MEDLAHPSPLLSIPAAMSSLAPCLHLQLHSLPHHTFPEQKGNELLVPLSGLGMLVGPGHLPVLGTVSQGVCLLDVFRLCPSHFLNAGTFFPVLHCIIMPFCLFLGTLELPARV
jgi:hypothetical protein